MPPKPKYTREEIIAAALELVSEKGMSALTARDLGTRLGTSARPIFTAFQSMDEVQETVVEAAMKRFEEYAHKTVADECLDTIQTDYGLPDEDAKTLFEHSWIHTYGIATMCATGMCNFTQEEISKMLTQDFTAMMTLLKGNKRG